MHHTMATGDGVASSNGGGEGSRRSLFFPRRAVMYVPACDERKVLKTTTISVDSIIFDIEDGVAVNQKVHVQCKNGYRALSYAPCY